MHLIALAGILGMGSWERGSLPQDCQLLGELRFELRVQRSFPAPHGVLSQHQQYLQKLATAQPSGLPDRHSEANPAPLWQLAVPPGLLSSTGCNLSVLVLLQYSRSGLLTAAEQCCSKSGWACKAPGAKAGPTVPGGHGRPGVAAMHLVSSGFLIQSCAHQEGDLLALRLPF